MCMCDPSSRRYRRFSKPAAHHSSLSLSLYSTRTQNTWRRGLALGSAPDARILRWRYQHVGIFWRYLTLKFASPPTPKPNASQWNIVCVGFSALGLALAMYISYLFVFISFALGSVFLVETSSKVWILGNGNEIENPDVQFPNLLGAVPLTKNVEMFVSTKCS